MLLLCKPACPNRPASFLCPHPAHKSCCKKTIKKRTHSCTSLCRIPQDFCHILLCHRPFAAIDPAFFLSYVPAHFCVACNCNLLHPAASSQTSRVRAYTPGLSIDPFYTRNEATRHPDLRPNVHPVHNHTPSHRFRAVPLCIRTGELRRIPCRCRILCKAA